MAINLALIFRLLKMNTINEIQTTTNDIYRLLSNIFLVDILLET